MIGSLGQNIIYLVDTSFIGRLSEADLGASALGGIYYFLLFMIGNAMNTGMQVMVARRKGEGNDHLIGEVVDHQAGITLAFAFLCFIAMHFYSTRLLTRIIHSEEIRNKTLSFLQFRSYGIFFGLVNSCLMAFFIGIGNTKVNLWTTGVMVTVNVLGLYFLVFGNCGFPRMGIGGAGLASSIAEATVTIVIIVFLFAKKFNHNYQLFRFVRLKTDLIKRMFKLSAPLMMQQVFSIGAWWYFFISIEHLGERQLAISNLIRSLYTFYGIPVWALASTTNSMTSNLIGQGTPGDVISLIKKIAVISISFSLVFGMLINLFPVPAMSVYTNDKDLIIASIPTLRVLTSAIILFSFSILTIFAVSGTGATNVSMIIEVITIFIYVVYVYFSSHIFKWNLPEIWLAEPLYWICTFIMCSWYLKNGGWSEKRV